MKRITNLLVANRGEVAVRIQRTAQRMGIATVAVFSDADADALHVRVADRAVRIGAPPSSESYLRIDRLLDAAQRSGADAVHPGFGFLAENADFAEACTSAGLAFVGPSAATIRAMGSKKEAKRLAVAAGVPVVPGYDGADQSPSVLAARAVDTGFPLLLKASAGGGGKGMRIVREAAELDAAIAGAKREAKSAFGDDTLIIEKYIHSPRHVEIQILGDEHGTLLHLFERECSIQRRHQKIVEESPSPALDASQRRRMGEAAIAVGRSVGYTSAGTVEFIVAPDGAFHFLEVNTRLQVEHPVTELVTGLDIVKEQLRVARGEPLGYGQADVAQRGHAVEVRLYAEDPDNGFLPTSGKLVEFTVPEADGLRVDSGVESGTEVGIHYDPMLAKIIAHAPTRAEAVQKLARVLAQSRVHGIKTNRAFLLRVLEHPEFAAGNTHTHFIDDHLGVAVPTTPEVLRRAAVAATLAGFEQRRASRALLPELVPGYRNNPFSAQAIEYRHGEATLRVEYQALGDGNFHVNVDGVPSDVRLAAGPSDDLAIELDGRVEHFHVRADGARWFVQSLDASITLTELPRFPEVERVLAAGACVAPMPGKVVRVLVSEGQSVKAGEVLVILEAMKMEHSVKAPADGLVQKLDVREGDQVAAEAVLVVVG